MKKILSICLVIALIITTLPMGAFEFKASAATSGTTGDCTWTLDGTVLIISGNGAMGDYNSYASSYKAPWGRTITSVIIKDGVTSIGRVAFGNCSSLETISIPNSVTSIGEYAFYGCTNLKSITIPDSVISIGSSAFHGCTSIESITLPFVGSSRTVTISTNSVFGYLFGSATGNVSGTIKQYYTSGDYRYYYIPTSLRSVTITAAIEIPYGAFSNCGMLTSITIPNSVTSIGEYAFYNCNSLTNVTIPNSVTSIGEYAFYKCNSLTNVTIPDSITIIDDYVFQFCDSLTSITIPNSVTRVGERAFSSCSGLTSITIPDSVTSIGGSAFYNTGYYINADNWENNVLYVGNHLVAAKTSVSSSYIIKEGTLTIANATFSSCDSLKNITIPDSVTSIGDYTFQYCDSLTSITIPNSVTSIGEYAFYYCDSLESITIPNSVISIGSFAFQGCDLLKYVYYTGSSADKTKMYISSYNGKLTRISWCYNSCIGSATHSYANACDTLCDVCYLMREASDHIYDNTCDITCNICGLVREVPDHSYTINGEHTCDICKYSKTPNSPILNHKYSGTVVLVPTEGFEYSDDGVKWQDSNVFKSLAENETHTFYQRVKASNKALVSETSEPMVVVLKFSSNSPVTPIVSSFTDKTVTLVPVFGCEYSLDCINWQKDSIFGSLSPATEYSFYQRKAETDEFEASPISESISVITDKSKQNEIPPVPVLQRVSSNSITLVPINGCEYSKNGTTWQTSNIFSGLSCGTEYTFYQRYKETATLYAGKSSEFSTFKTDKGTQTAPLKPTLDKVSYNRVSLVSVDGYEYSRDGVAWQTSSVFENLEPETNYFFYQRKIETDKYYVSDMSDALIVRTLEKPLYTPGDINDDEEIDLTDVVTLSQVAAKWQGINHNVAALDVNGDDEITLQDIVHLSQFVAGWDVTLH